MAVRPIASASRAWRRVLAALGVAAAAWAGPAPAESFVVLSLIGDRVTIVSAGGQTGTHLDDNRYDVLRFRDSAFDDWIAGVTAGAIGRTRPQAKVTMLRITDPAIYALGASGRNASAPSMSALVSSVSKSVPEAANSRVVLVVPLRWEPQLLSYRGYLGHGNVAGLGFYIGGLPVERSALPGYLGTFANFQLVLFDARADRIEVSERVVVGRVHSVAQSSDGSSWNSLSPERKVEVLQSLVRDEIDRRMPLLLSARN